MSDSVRPHRRQPARLPCPWDSPGKSTGVGCHFLLQCVKVKSEKEVIQSCLTLCDSMACSPPDFSVHGILKAGILEWVAIPSSRASSPPRDGTHVCYISSFGRRILYCCATWESPTIFKEGEQSRPSPTHPLRDGFTGWHLIKW